MIDTSLAKKINLFVLFAGIILIVLLCPHQKKLFYDEPFQIMCAKGITAWNIDKFSTQGIFTSADLNKENTFHAVFTLGGDSIHYILLHYLTDITGNGINTYVYFSVFWAALAFISFYYLSKDILGDNIYVSVAMFLLFINFSFLTQAYSIRHYIMSLFFANMSGIYFFRYYFKEKTVKNLLLLATFCVLSFISHYFTAYIITIYVIAVLINEKLSFFSKRNMLTLAGPVLFLGIYYYFHPNPISGMSYYSNYTNRTVEITQREIGKFAYFSHFIKSVAVNFQLLYSLFKDNLAVRLGSFLLILSVYFFGIKKLMPSIEERKKYHLLFILGTFSCIFLALLAYKTVNPHLFSYRYFLFSMSFCSIFVALFMKTLFQDARFNIAIKAALVFLLVAPSLVKFGMTGIKRGSDNPLECNHLLVVQKIIANNVHKLEVPEAVDAVFINSLLPDHYDVTYQLTPTNDSAALHYGDNVEKIKLFKNELIVTF